MNYDEKYDYDEKKVLVAVRLHRPSTGSYLSVNVTSAELAFLDELYPGWERIGG